MAGVFGAINLSSVGIWTALEIQMRRFVINPVRLRLFNISVALLLPAPLCPVLAD
ncbi:hypothetical protein HKD42_07200 [Altererythrobacter sp. RZ02]|uniref:Uncharacterized protein n=1 Tax=Pontixanthobacter rizhaonensis TaxID=2730337 RepID=A0A848QGV1_9SPHN|nr:hypothetical protein [Pontixanthobacter rizhaonensis]NMW31842.1 hypothetical protein [Pontixanthobacter rizhaonensis]